MDSHRGPAEPPKQPAGHRITSANRPRLPRQYQEGRLKRVLGRVPVAQGLVADPQNHRPVAFHQSPKSRLAGRPPILEKPLQQLTIAEAAHHSGGKEVLKLPEQRIRS